jgi:hypothetical protein
VWGGERKNKTILVLVSKKIISNKPQKRFELPLNIVIDFEKDGWF